ncbi:hypothetical protein EDB92DRAFT_296572 [Lactarius akahatsu]|uniref:Uncharacterized protein n=1 Tax=Lactarius akahatsu TaxID=416441 RepID=A0AAD4LL82_9AGAM|nr:hypothetical protein EDB92DRAFT_296572 [Lactarius akahatsu]
MPASSVGRQHQAQRYWHRVPAGSHYLPVLCLFLHSYCQDMKLGEWQSALRTAQKGTAMSFLLYLCENYDIKSSGTCWQYFRRWKQLYAKTVGQYMDINERLKVYKSHLIPKFHVKSPTLRTKRLATQATSSDSSFNFAHDHHIFPSKRQHLDVAACYLTIAYTGCWPAEVADGGQNILLDDVCWKSSLAPELPSRWGHLLKTCLQMRSPSRSQSCWNSRRSTVAGPRPSATRISS